MTRLWIALAASLMALACTSPASPAPIDVSAFDTKTVEKLVFYTDFEEARRVAKASRKPLVAYFTYDT